MKTIYQTKVLVRFKRKYLLLKKVNDIHKDHIGMWEVPGGKIKTNEKPVSAGLREIKEETKLKCKIISELKFLKLDKNGIKTHTYVYLAETNNNKVILSDEHSDFIFVSYKNIDKLSNIIYKDLFKQYVIQADKIKSKTL